MLSCNIPERAIYVQLVLYFYGKNIVTKHARKRKNTGEGVGSAAGVRDPLDGFTAQKLGPENNSEGEKTDGLCTMF